MGHQRQEDCKMRCSELAAFRSTAFRHNSAGLGFAVSADSLCLRVSTYVSANGRAWFRHASFQGCRALARRHNAQPSPVAEQPCSRQAACSAMQSVPIMSHPSQRPQSLKVESLPSDPRVISIITLSAASRPLPTPGSASGLLPRRSGSALRGGRG